MDKKQFLLFIAAVAFAISISSLLSNFAKVIVPRAGGPFVVSHDECGGDDAKTSTTSRAALYTTDTASTTCTTFDIEGADQIDLNLIVRSTTTPPTIQWNYEFSFDGNNWFPEDGTTVTNNTKVTHGATKVIHAWTFATTTQSVGPDWIQRNITVPNVASKKIRILFGTTVANAQIWAQIVAKREY